MAYKPKILPLAAGGTALSSSGTSTNVLTSNGTTWTSAANPWFYVITGSCAGASPADGQTYFIQTCYSLTNFTSYSYPVAMMITKAGTITRFHARFFIGNAPTSETSTFVIRLNNTTDYTITSTQAFTGGGSFDMENTSMNVPVAVGDDICVRWDTPTWSTNPTTSTMAYTIYVKV